MQKMKIITGPQCRKAIKAIRTKTKWSSRRTAEHLGWPQETLRKIERGYTVTPSQERMDQVAALYDSLKEV